MTESTGCGHGAAHEYRTKRGRAGCRLCDRSEYGGRHAPPAAEETETEVSAWAGRLSALAREIAERTVEAVPEVGIERFRSALLAWASAEAVAEALREHLDTVGLVSPRGSARASLISTLGSAERTAEKLRTALGLSPHSAAVIRAQVRSGGLGLLTDDEASALGVEDREPEYAGPRPFRARGRA
ncbi:hypothetical protein [Agromyces sp. PvR057]|uniref:hypothetical protein n=1 Tax=Agromyces sp. PvR057 TaxID=3156403 RepID=UPI0033979F07